MSTFKRYQCWHHERIGEVINKEAIAVDIADFMATHTPLGQIRRVQAGDGQELSETTLLEDLIRGAQNDRHIFTVIQGIPGTGKSHLIRWLYERYQRERGELETVLLIERAQNSLLGTLRQIIAKLDIVSDSLQQQIDKLRGAADSLSARALKDNLLDQLRIATYEYEESSKGQIRRNIEHFLLDPNIRTFLKRDGGPLDRIASFLTKGRQREESSDRPEFQADDFQIESALLRSLQTHGYAEARTLAEALDLRPNLRDDLAAYLNRLLDYAIGHTVALSADDLRQTFNELRRELRRQGKGLALFIEDITAFTGIDQGLIDVLATQHTGEANREFCRMTSVIGITDDYYQSRFPDNLRQRITDLLTLDYSVGDKKAAGLLHSPTAAAHLSARYLNAMRSTQAEIKLWFEDGAQEERIPNHCTDCPHRETCHAAFGAVNIAPPDSPPVEVGLYPFNQQALWNMYQRLDETLFARTPRSLLYQVLYDVLQAHGPKVLAGSFPPAPKEFAPGIPERNLPALAEPVQQRSLRSQAGSDESRVQSLILFWGDRTITIRREGGVQTVGNLTPQVFQAFDIKPIEGLESGSSSIPEPTRTSVEVPETKNDRTELPPNPRPEPEPVTGTKYDADIERWRTGGKLEQYEDLRRFLITFIEHAIDWGLHGVPAGMVDERIKPGRFEIEGQSGRASGDRLVFQRSNELAYVLQALADLQTYGTNIRPDILGAHMVTLNSWLRANEQRIINFVLQPSADQPSPMKLVELLLLDCLLIDMLSGNLRSTSTTPVDLLKTIIKHAAVEISNRPSTEQDWSLLIQRAGETHSREWVNLLRNIRSSRARSCRSQLLKQLNQPQGTSSSIHFLDAATALDILSRLNKRDWILREIPSIDERATAIWKDASTVYTQIAERLDDVLSAEISYQAAKLQELKEKLGEDTADTVMKEVDAFLNTLKDNNIPYTLKEAPGKGKLLHETIQFINTTCEEKGRKERAVRISASERYMQLLHGFVTYLNEVNELAGKINTQQKQTISQLQANNSAMQLEKNTLAKYDEILTLLNSLTASAQPQEVHQ